MRARGCRPVTMAALGFRVWGDTLGHYPRACRGGVAVIPLSQRSCLAITIFWKSNPLLDILGILTCNTAEPVKACVFSSQSWLHPAHIQKQPVISANLLLTQIKFRLLRCASNSTKRSRCQLITYIPKT